ncbi:MAG: hypothetical protein ABEJ99_03570 [Candidatus Nanohaloarchaea archaeon]
MSDRPGTADFDRIEEGYTNQVYRTDRGTVLKFYCDNSLGSLFHMLRELIVGQRLMKAPRRIEAEKEVRRVLGNDFRFPRIVDEGDDWLEFELIEDRSVSEMMDKEPTSSWRLGRQVGELMNGVHAEEVFLSDWALEDMIVTDQGLALMDFEFGGKIDQSSRVKHDRISLFTRTAALETGPYRDFMDGFRSEVSIHKSTVLSGFLVSFFFNLFYVWKDGRPGNVLKNGLHELR